MPLPPTPPEPKPLDPPHQASSGVYPPPHPQGILQAPSLDPVPLPPTPRNRSPWTPPPPPGQLRWAFFKKRHFSSFYATKYDTRCEICSVPGAVPLYDTRCEQAQASSGGYPPLPHSDRPNLYIARHGDRRRSRSRPRAVAQGGPLPFAHPAPHCLALILRVGPLDRLSTGKVANKQGCR